MALASCRFLVYPHYRHAYTYDDFQPAYVAPSMVDGYKDYKPVLDANLALQEGLVAVPRFASVDLYENKEFLPLVRPGDRVAAVEEVGGTRPGNPVVAALAEEVQLPDYDPGTVYLRAGHDQVFLNFLSAIMVAEGWKYNLDDIRAALLVDQLDRLDVLHTRRQQIVDRYDAGFAGAPGITRPRAPGTSAHHLYTLWVDPERRDAILHELKARGVAVAVNYRAIHTLTYLRETLGHAPEDFPEAWRIGRSTITLPLYPKLTDAQIDSVIETVRDVAR